MQCYVITVISRGSGKVGTLRVETVGFFLILMILPVITVTIPASLTDKFSKVVIIKILDIMPPSKPLSM